MDRSIAEFLTLLIEDPMFGEVVESVLLPGIPSLPEYNIDPETGLDNTAQWKHLSAFRDGYRSCLAKLGVYNSNDE